MTRGIDPLKVSRENIWEYSQNKPALIIEDMARVFDLGTKNQRQKIYKILMARGVNKWFRCRSEIIHLKNAMKTQVREIQAELTHLHAQLKPHEILKNLDRDKPEDLVIIKKRNELHKRIGYLRGYLAAKTENGAIIRKICHSQRWVDWRYKL